MNNTKELIFVCPRCEKKENKKAMIIPDGSELKYCPDHQQEILNEIRR